MCLMKTLHAFRRRNNTQKFNMLSAVFLNKIYRCHRGTARCQHRVKRRDRTLLNRAWQLAVILLRLMRVMVAA